MIVNERRRIPGDDKYFANCGNCQKVLKISGERTIKDSQGHYFCNGDCFTEYIKDCYPNG